MKLTIYGAGGPVAAGAVGALEGRHELLLTDLAAMDTAHPFRPVDITRGEQVRAAAEGADCLINCTVVRQHPELAFRVNCEGAYHVMRAAVELGIPRVIHTGPAIIFGRAGYWHDFDIIEDAPPRPGLELYAMSKYLGWQVVRTFCRRHPELCVVAFVYTGFLSGDPHPDHGVPPFAVDYRDAGQAFRLGVEVPREALPSNCELFNISADMPHGRVDLGKAKRLLGYAPEHNFAATWSRRARAAVDQAS